MNGKLFNLEPNYVWKGIFEARFGNLAMNGLGNLYQSNKFQEILNRRGYEFMFRSFFTKGASEAVDGDCDDNPASDFPDSKLNAENIFFVAMIECRDSFGFPKAIHCEVFDEPQKIEEFMSGSNTYKKTLPENEARQQIKQSFNKYFSSSTQSDTRWVERVKKRYNDQPQNFHPGFSRTFDSHCAKAASPSSTEEAPPLVQFMLAPEVTIFALRLDTYSCTILSKVHRFESDNSRISPAERISPSEASFSSSQLESLKSPRDFLKLPLNQDGFNFACRLIFDRCSDWLEESNQKASENICDVSMSLPFSMNLGRERNEFVLQFDAHALIGNGECENDYEGGPGKMDMYRVLDYGIDWK